MQHTFVMNEARAEQIFAMTKSHIAALHNWIATAIESGRFDDAEKMVADLRAHQEIFAAFNMEAKHFIAKSTSKPLETVHSVRPR